MQIPGLFYSILEIPRQCENYELLADHTPLHYARLACGGHVSEDIFGV